MEIESHEHRLLVRGLEGLNAANAATCRDRVRTALTRRHHAIDIDMSRTKSIDSSGIGALVALHKSICEQGGRLRILNPSPVTQQILELTRMHLILEIVAC